MAALVLISSLAAAGEWIVGAEQPSSWNHIQDEGTIMFAEWEPGLMLGRRWDGGWHLMLGVRHRNLDQEADYERGEDSIARRDDWVRLHCGKRLLAEGPWEVRWDLEGIYARKYYDFGHEGESRRRTTTESWGLGLALRPAVRVWKSLQIETSMGFQWMRTEEKRSSGTALREESRTRRVSIHPFEFESEYDVSLTYAF